MPVFSIEPREVIRLMMHPGRKHVGHHGSAQTARGDDIDLFEQAKDGRFHFPESGTQRNTTVHETHHVQAGGR